MENIVLSFPLSGLSSMMAIMTCEHHFCIECSELNLDAQKSVRRDTIIDVVKESDQLTQTKITGVHRLSLNLSKTWKILRNGNSTDVQSRN